MIRQPEREQLNHLTVKTLMRTTASGHTSEVLRARCSNSIKVNLKLAAKSHTCHIARHSYDSLNCPLAVVGAKPPAGAQLMRTLSR